MDRIVGADELTPTAEKMRRLMHYGQIYQSHALHFFYLAAPDLLFGFGADPALRNVVGVARKHPELAVQGVMMRKYGQQVVAATAGKRIHGTGAIPGGINKNLSTEERDAFLQGIDQQRQWARETVKIARDYTFAHPELESFEVPMPQVSGPGAGLVPGWAARQDQHCGLHRHPGGRGGTPGVCGRDRRQAPGTTSREWRSRRGC